MQTEREEGAVSDNNKVARSDDGLGGVCQAYQDWPTVSGQFLLYRPSGYKTYRAADVSIRFNFANLTDGLLACREDHLPIISTII